MNFSSGLLNYFSLVLALWEWFLTQFLPTPGTNHSLEKQCSADIKWLNCCQAQRESWFLIRIWVRGSWRFQTVHSPLQSKHRTLRMSAFTHGLHLTGSSRETIDYSDHLACCCICVACSSSGFELTSWVITFQALPFPHLTTPKG